MSQRLSTLRERSELLEQARDAIAVCDFETGRIEYWNQGAVDLYGFSAAEAEGQVVYELLKPKWPRPLAEIHQLLREHGTWDGELVHVRKDGSLAVVEGRVVLLHQESSHAQLLLIFRDVTRRKRVEERLRENEQRYRVVYNRAPIGICRIGTDGSILDMNPSLEAFLEVLPAGAMLGRKLVELTHPDDVEDVLRLYADLAAGRRDRFSLEMRYVTGSGQIAWGNLTVSPVRDPEDRTLYFVAMVEDISERKRAEQELIAALEAERRANEQLEKLHKDKSMFVAIVSHEFRTALTGILGFAELMRVEDLSMDEMKEYAADIEKDAQRLRRMINELLDLERMESGQMRLQLERFGLNAVISEEVERLRANPAGHQFRLDLQENVGEILADRDKVIQVIANLLSNAVKYSPGGGLIEVASRLDEGRVQVSVRDHGLGIPAAALGRLFQRYARIESSESRLINGTGLGLAIVRQIVEMHGGRVWVESELGAGSTFHLTLRVDGPEEPI